MRVECEGGQGAGERVRRGCGGVEGVDVGGGRGCASGGKGKLADGEWSG